ncbi:carbohydrate ABC transporter permease [Paenibacillus sp.]|uniref:carbohydrate ABC transporter permease n=1 Tax=Paenibacillus sp. TaxID=58172 RepID=UPI002D4CC1BD|nr:carbohydrate ABC transporter permease [Paenibacillus sp.]HZG58130.1 carbohydrate ABC transporter permease [Paenibacillus sp.]
MTMFTRAPVDSDGKPAAPRRVRPLRKYSLPDIIFNSTMYLSVTVVTFLCMFPFLNTVANAFSSNTAIQSGLVVLWPVEFQFDAMNTVLTDETVIRSLFVTVFITIVGTALNLLFTIITAYPLSRRDLKGRAYFMNYMIITMLFSGGMIPSFLLVKELGLLDKLWALIIPSLISAFNVIIMKTFMQGLPDELREAAIVDGCGNIKYLVRVVLPLSGASLATIGLFYAVGHWNSYFSAVLYIENPDLHTLQVKLRNILLLSQMNTSIELLQIENQLDVIKESLKSAVVVFATAPILIVYPFLQKYFVKGAMLGSVKG